jgi:hypothetical protein
MKTGSRRSCALLLLTLPFAGIAAFGQTNPFTTSNLPIVIIETNGQEIPDEPKITADMGIIDNGPGQRNAVTDSFNVYGGKIGIEIRGSSSQEFPKKQYGIELRDTLGNDVPVSLLGLPPDADWVLSAGYDDKTLMRNALAYFLAGNTGRYASRSRFCELVLNGEYVGVYVLFERIKRDKNRVNITKLKSTDITGDALTGGYIFKVDWNNSPDGESWESPYLPYPDAQRPIEYIYESPKPADLLEVQKAYLRTFVTDFETAVNDSGFSDSGFVYTRYFDRGSAVDYFLVNEMARNVDAYRLSLYMYKDRDSKGGKLVVGPVWDFNAGFGNVNYHESADTVGWNLLTLPGFVAESGDGPIPFWWNRLSQDSSFWRAIRQRWGALRTGPLATSRILGFVDSIATYIDEAQQRNFERWPILDVYVAYNAYVGGTYANEIAYLKTWTLDRLAWMDRTLEWVPTPPDTTDDTLRVQISGFAANVTDSIVALSWQTALEKNTRAFVVQRRLSGLVVPDTTWVRIGAIGAADTSSHLRSYAFADTVHGGGRFLYRLKVEGKDSQFVYSSSLDVIVTPPDDTLRVQIGALTATVTDSVIALSWHTTRERNTTAFDIQRRHGGATVHDSVWTKIGTLPAADTSSVLRSYAFADTIAHSDTLQYRLKVGGKNGQFLFADTLTIAPAPHDDTLHIQISTFSAKVADSLVTLSWKTTKEKNTALFVVQRRFTGPLVTDSSWVKIGQVAAADTSSLLRSYAFTDTLHGLAGAWYRLKIEGKNGDSAYSSELKVSLVDVDRGTPVLPVEYALLQNYPNPFNPSTTIAYDLPRAGFVTLMVYDYLGRQVATLVQGEMPAGRHLVLLDASAFASGVYVFRLQAGEFAQSRKMILMR